MPFVRLQNPSGARFGAMQGAALDRQRRSNCDEELLPKAAIYHSCGHRHGDGSGPEPETQLPPLEAPFGRKIETGPDDAHANSQRTFYRMSVSSRILNLSVRLITRCLLTARRKMIGAPWQITHVRRSQSPPDIRSVACRTSDRRAAGRVKA